MLKMTKISLAAMTVALMAGTGAATAAVSADEAARLKTTLTPLGAERAGNKDGSIPPWEGGLTKVPKPGEISPTIFTDKPILTITAANVEQYRDKLAEGTLAMFKKYPDFRMEVYKSQRTAAAPQWVYDHTFRNATAARSTQGGMSISNVYGGIPFPIPKTGAEVMWNHLLAYDGDAARFQFRVWMVDAAGKRVLASEAITERQMPYYDPQGSQEKFDGTFSLVRNLQVAPAFKAGEQVLVHDPVDQIGAGRQAWQYLVGQRRVRRAPSIGYDTPNFVASGTSNFDEVNMFNGALDRYEWKLVGKKEMYIPYNTYKASYETKAEDLFKPNHLNPDKVRWELHRVFVVEGTLKQGKRHIYGKRVYFFDEDKGAAMADIYDLSGKLWRVKLSGGTPSYDIPAANYRGGLTYDLVNGTYYMSSHTAETGGMPVGQPKPSSFFTAEALAGGGIR